MQLAALPRWQWMAIGLLAGLLMGYGGPAVQEYPSVLEFLGALHRVYKIDYRYAWWALHPILTWTTGCLVVIGGIWPTLVNLLAFGSFTRPPDVKPISLWNIRGSKPRPEPEAIYAAPSSNGEPEEKEELLLTPAEPQESSDAPAPAVQKLETAPLEAVWQGPADERSYGADKGDFYPTERHAPRAGPPR